jgi:hypothetical protein
MRLGQKEYVDDNGNKIDSSLVECITTYYHIADGFYEWDCSNCKEKHTSRACGWDINGQVLVCNKCGKRNLLLRSDVAMVKKGIGFAFEFENEHSLIDAYKKRTEEAEQKLKFVKDKLTPELQERLDKLFILNNRADELDDLKKRLKEYQDRYKFEMEMNAKNQEQLHAWFREYEIYIMEIFGYYPNECSIGSGCYQDHIVALLKEFCRLTGRKEPKGLKEKHYPATDFGNHTEHRCKPIKE